MNYSGSAFFLVTIAVGYWVLTLADKEGNKHAKIGKIIGWGIILFSILSILVNTVPLFSFMGGHGHGHFLNGGHPGHSHGQGHDKDGNDKDE